ncbi:unnamed protein product, partial [Acanthoscelides obtectus]
TKQLLDNTKESLTERKTNKFIGIETKIEVTKLKENSSEEVINLVQKFESEVSDFFERATGYLEKWSQSFVKFSIFDWMHLSHIPEWEDIEKTIIHREVLTPTAKERDGDRNRGVGGFTEVVTSRRISLLPELLSDLISKTEDLFGIFLTASLKLSVEEAVDLEGSITEFIVE